MFKNNLIFFFVEIQLRITKLIECVETCFQSKCISKHFSKSYIFVLRDKILSQPLYWGEMTDNDWSRLYEILKRLIRKPIHESETLFYVECLHLIIKWGPLYSFPVTLLRSEFDFIQELCGNLMECDKAIHEKFLNLLFEFCKNVRFSLLVWIL